MCAPIIGASASVGVVVVCAMLSLPTSGSGTAMNSGVVMLLALVKAGLVALHTPESREQGRGGLEPPSAAPANSWCVGADATGASARVQATFCGVRGLVGAKASGADCD